MSFDSSIAVDSLVIPTDDLQFPNINVSDWEAALTPRNGNDDLEASLNNSAIDNATSIQSEGLHFTDSNLFSSSGANSDIRDGFEDDFSTVDKADQNNRNQVDFQDCPENPSCIGKDNVPDNEDDPVCPSYAEKSNALDNEDSTDSPECRYFEKYNVPDNIDNTDNPENPCYIERFNTLDNEDNTDSPDNPYVEKYNVPDNQDNIDSPENPSYVEKYSVVDNGDNTDCPEFIPSVEKFDTPDNQDNVDNPECSSPVFQAIPYSVVVKSSTLAAEGTGAVMLGFDELPSPVSEPSSTDQPPQLSSILDDILSAQPVVDSCQMILLGDAGKTADQMDVTVGNEDVNMTASLQCVQPVNSSQNDVSNKTISSANGGDEILLQFEQPLIVHNSKTTISSSQDIHIAVNDVTTSHTDYNSNVPDVSVVNLLAPRSQNKITGNVANSVHIHKDAEVADSVDHFDSKSEVPHAPLLDLITPASREVSGGKNINSVFSTSAGVSIQNSLILDTSDVPADVDSSASDVRLNFSDIGMNL